MSVATYANSGSGFKSLLVCLVLSLHLSGCAESTDGSDDYGSGKPDRNSNIVAGAVVEIGDEWRYRKGTSAPSSDWISVGFDDTSWLAGNTGIGYGDDDDATILSDMRDSYATVYTRKVLNYDGSVSINSLELEIDYDDGFVAYINGQEVARANMPAGQPSFDTLASSGHEAGVAELVNLNGFINLIGIGDNVLAIEIHNRSLTNDDLTFSPRLLVNMGAPPPPPPPPPPTVSLSANPGNVGFNRSTTLSWNSTNATACAASGDWSGGKATSGSQSINALTTNSNFMLSCSGTGGSANDSVSVTVAAPSAPVVNLLASPANLPFNGSTTLSWTSSDTTNCTATGDWSGGKATSGSQTINTLTANSNFILSCSGTSGSANDSVSVTVAAPSAPVVNLSASLANLPFNGSTTLSWTSSDTTNCTATGDWSGGKATSGSETINALTANSNFMLSCSGTGGSANDSVSVTVSPPLIPSVDITASPTNVAYSGSITVGWTTSNVDTCIASGNWSNSRNTSGSINRNNLTSDKTYTLTCDGPNGSAIDSVSVTVADPPPTVTFSANPTNVSQNDSTTLSWSSTDATSCTASGDWSGNKGTSGAETISSLMIDSQFTLTCSGAGGTTNETVNVTVVVSNNELVKPSVNLTTENNNIYLNWSQSNADQYRVLYWQGNNAPQEQITTGTEYTFPPLGTGSYTVIVEAYDEMGNSLFSAPVTLEVF